MNLVSINDNSLYYNSTTGSIFKGASYYSNRYLGTNLSSSSNALSSQVSGSKTTLDYYLEILDNPEHAGDVAKEMIYNTTGILYSDLSTTYFSLTYETANSSDLFSLDNEDEDENDLFTAYSTRFIETYVNYLYGEVGSDLDLIS